MGRRTNISEEENYRNFLYCGWDPYSHDSVWLENGAYENLQRELDYYRKHPQNVKPDELLRFFASVMEQWRNDKNRFRSAMEDILSQYEAMLEAMRDREQEYQRLKVMLQEIQKKLQEQERTQQEIERKLTEIENERVRNEQNAVNLRNEAMEAFNGIVNDPYFQKYVMPELEAIHQEIIQIDNRRLAPEAKQAVAINALNRVFAVRAQVERQKLEFAAAQLLAITEATLIMDQFAHWRDNVYFDEEKQHKADMDFWSFQHFGEVMAAAETLCHRIRQGELAAGYMVSNLTDDLEQIKQLQKEGEHTVANVFNCCSTSEQCEQLGLLTAVVLYEDFHFELMANGYDDNDLRHGYVIEMENHAMGCKIRFLFSPVSQTQSVGCYQISFQDYVDEMLLSSFESKLLNELKENGIPVSQHREQDKDTWGNVVEELVFTPRGEKIRLPEEMRIWEHTNETQTQ